MPTPVVLPFREVHMDFHTSEHIHAVGSDFDPDVFADTLAAASVNSVTCFARCHHGYLYYPSQINPERIHPHLKRSNLLGEQIAACHKRGIRVPIYTTIQWDHYSAQRHPEWLTVGPNGGPQAMKESGPFEAGFYRYLCLNSPYRDFLKAHVREILTLLPTDGLFFDIVWNVDCACRYCRAEMQRLGMDETNKGERKAYSDQMLTAFMREMTQWVRKTNATCSIYYNNGNVHPGYRAALPSFTHLEFDALPSDSANGYMNFPRRARFDRNLGVDCVGQTGKFHRGWGDVHSYKNPAALQFDCFQLLSLGIKCMIGDQLDPSGKIDAFTYDLVGDVYRSVQEKEPWCENVRHLVDIGVLVPSAFGSDNRTPESRAAAGQADVGATRILQEGAHQFDLLDGESDFERYRVLLLPDRVLLSPEAAAKIQAYLAGGGSILTSFASGMDEKMNDFVLPEWGVRLAGDGPHTLSGDLVRGEIIGWKQAHFADYLVPQGQIGQGLPPIAHVMYTKSMDVVVDETGEGRTLVSVMPPVFYRTHQHFSSHMHAPVSEQSGGPGIVQSGRVIYFAHAIFELYDAFAALWYKRLVLNALQLLMPDPLLRHNGPSTLIATVNAQEAEERWVVHLLHYIPERRATYVTVVEDVIPLQNVRVSLRVSQMPTRITCEPGGDEVPFTAEDENRVAFVVPHINGHQMVCVQFEKTHLGQTRENM